MVANNKLRYTRCISYPDDGRCNGLMERKDECAYHYCLRRSGVGGARNMSKQQVESIVNLYSSGMSANQVAARLGISKPTVLRHARKNGVSRPEEQSKGIKYISDESKERVKTRAINRHRLFRERNCLPEPTGSKALMGRKYQLFRKRMLARDSWACVLCGYTGKDLNLDHIKPRAIFPELTYSEDNVRTLCIPCHKNTDTYAGKMYKYIKERLA